MSRAAVRRVAEPLLGWVRRGRVVAWTPHWMGFGNVLLLAQWAEEGRRNGHPRWVLETEAVRPWIEVFPGLRSVVLNRRDVRFTDQRVMPWSAAERAKAGPHVSRPYEPIDVEAVERFVRSVLLAGNPSSSTRVQDDLVVVNIRRGDYYADADTRRQYGFDIASFVRSAVEQSVSRDGLPERFVIVSDDLDWCRQELQWLQSVAPTHFPTTSGPVEDFSIVSAARRLVITNSTFSYWAAHVGNVLHGDNHAQVWAPRFFDRTQNDGRSWLLDERWSVIEDLPEGWEPPEDRASPGDVSDGGVT